MSFFCRESTELFLYNNNKIQSKEDYNEGVRVIGITRHCGILMGVDVAEPSKRGISLRQVDYLYNYGGKTYTY